MKKTIYLADVGFRGNLAEVVVEEKKETYKVLSSRDIAGWTWAGKLIKKTDSRICPTLESALLRMEQLAKEISNEKLEEYEQAKAVYQELRDIVDVYEKDPERVMSAISNLKE